MGRKAANRAVKTTLLELFCMVAKYMSQAGFRSTKLVSWEKWPKFCFQISLKTTVISGRIV